MRKKKALNAMNAVNASYGIAFILARTFVEHLDNYAGYRENLFFQEVAAWVARNHRLCGFLLEEAAPMKWEEFQNNRKAQAMRCIGEMVMNNIVVIANANRGLSVAHFALYEWLAEFMPDIEVVRSKELRPLVPDNSLWSNMSVFLSPGDDGDAFSKNSASRTWIRRCGNIYLKIGGGYAIPVKEELGIIDIIRSCGVAYEIRKKPPPWM